MFLFSEQYTTGVKANLDTPLNIISALTSKTFEGLEEIIALNMTTVRASLTDSLSSTKELLAAKGPQEFFTLSTTLMQPNVEKFLAYGRHLSSISASTQAEFIKAAVAAPVVEVPAVKAAVAAPVVEVPAVKAAVAAPVVEVPAVKAAVAAPVVEVPAVKAAVAAPVVEVPAVKAAVAASNKKKPGRFKK